MSGRNEVTLEITNLIHGVITNGNAKDLPKGAAVKLANAELIKPGIVSKAKGYTAIAKYVDNRVYEVLQYLKSGLDITLVFGINTAGTSAGVGYISGTWASGLVVTETITGCAVSETISLVQGGDYAYFFDGTNDKYFDGTSWRAIGLEAPSLAPTSSGLYDGALTDSGDYLFELRRYNSSTGARSNPSPITGVMTAGTAGDNEAGFSLAFDAGDSSVADYTEIYRTVAFGTKMFREALVSISATSYNSIVSDSTLTRQYRAETGDDQPPLMKIVRVGGQEMLGVENLNPNRVRWCKYSDQFGTMWQSWPAKNFSDCDPEGRDEIKAVYYCNGTWFVFKSHTMGVLYELGGGYRAYRKLADVGIVGIRAVTSVQNKVVWMSQKNIHMTDGQTVKDIGGSVYGVAIQDKIQALNFSKGDRFSACCVPGKNQVRFSVIPSGQAYPKLVLVGHYQFFDVNGVFSWTTREPGPVASTHPGIQAGSQSIVKDTDGTDQWIFGNSDGSGYIYKGDYGDSDFGSNIYSDWHFHRETFGNGRITKTASDFTVEVLTEGSETQVGIGIRKDGQETINILKTATVDSSGFLLDTDYLDTGVLGDPSLQAILVPCNKEVKDVMVVIRNDSTDYIELHKFTQSAVMGANR